MRKKRENTAAGRYPLEGSGLFDEVLRKLDAVLSRYTGKEPGPIDTGGARAFLWDGISREFRPVRESVLIHPDDLLGVDENKETLLANTASFVRGKHVNNVLLWGERGTGKSSLIKSVMTAFAGTPLRMIQVHKRDILSIDRMYGVIRENRAHRFVIFIDDLSFEEGQTDYKELKSIMDGGLEQIPDNLVFYATSNRKHLISTRFSDRDDDEIRPADAFEEKISLVDRFGIRLSFHHFPQEVYLSIVDLYARRYGVAMQRETLRRLALQWATATGGMNGRSAEQFARSASSRLPFATG